jgi:hypothetical protein
MAVNQNQNPIFVIGSDVDRELVLSRAFSRGDHLLVEMNGGRIFSKNPNRCVTAERWDVVSNKTSLTLRHPSVCGHDLVLPYASLLPGGLRQPAVFMIHDTYFAPGPLYIILQFIDSVVSGDYCSEAAFSAEGLKHIPKQDVITGLIRGLKDFSDGWDYRGICRFSLRANVRAKIIDAFRKENWDVLNTLDRKTLTRIAEELSWLPCLLRQNGINVETAPQVTD